VFGEVTATTRQENRDSAPPPSPGQQQRLSRPPPEHGNEAEEEEEEEEDHDDVEKKRKKRNPKACSVCGHYLAAWPDCHVQTQLRNQKLKGISAASTTTVVDNSNCNMDNSSSTSDKKKGPKTRAWNCTNTDEKLPEKTKYTKGQCARQCTVCKLFIESLTAQNDSVAKKKKV